MSPIHQYSPIHHADSDIKCTSIYVSLYDTNLDTPRPGPEKMVAAPITTEATLTEDSTAACLDPKESSASLMSLKFPWVG